MTDKPEYFAGYVPVIHDGYIQALYRHPDAIIGIFNNEILKEYDYIRKDIRALSPEYAEKSINGLGRKTIILGKFALHEILKQQVAMPNDDISRNIQHENPHADIILEPIFLRWDRDNSIEQKSITPDKIISIDSDDPITTALNKEKSLSTNWWRHIGAVVIDENMNIKLSSHNSPLPTEYTSLIEGDPRIITNKGIDIELSIDIHAEARIIAEASKHGMKLDGMTMCVTTFPCPNCAKLIALSGIKSCYFVDGYAMLDGYRILKDFDIEIIKLNTIIESDDQKILKPYPNKPSQF